MAKSVLGNAFWFASYQELTSQLQTHSLYSFRRCWNWAPASLSPALGCAVLRRGMTRGGKGPCCFLSPWGAVGQHFSAPPAAVSSCSISWVQFLVFPAYRISTMAPFAVMALSTKVPCSKVHGLSSCVRAPLPPPAPDSMHPGKFWLLSLHPSVTS